MIEELEIKGLWWLPENPNFRLPGTLTFSPYKGFSLELQGSFSERNIFFRPDIILGFSNLGKEITLYNCFVRKYRFNLAGIPETVFSANFGFIGAHFAQLSDIKFKRISVKYNYLDEWLNINGFNITFKSEEISVEIKYKLPSPIEINLKNGLKILLEFRVCLPSLSIVQTEACVKQQSFLTIESPEEMTFDIFHGYIYIFQSLFSLFTSEVVYPVKILGYFGKTKRNDYEPVEIIYQIASSLSNKVNKSLLPHDMLCPYAFIKERVVEVFNNWLEKSILLKPVYDLYFAIVYSSDLPLEFKFLSIVMALEVYHRRMVSNEDIPANEHERKIKEILSNTPEQYKNWLKEKLEYSNEPSLRKRIKEIYGMLENICYVTNLIPNKKDFVNKVVNTRNYFVHYDQSLENEASKGPELYWLIQQIKILVEICLLKELCFSDSEVDNILSKSRKYQFLIRQMNDLK